MRVLWGRITSVNVQKAVFALDELALPYERREAGGAFGVVGTPAYRAMNPNGLIPVLQDGDLTLWESNVIVRYFCAKHAAGTLWPEDPAERALADRWADWQQTTFQPALGPAFMNLVRTPPERRDAAAVAASCEATERQMALLDAHLSGQPWLGGDRMTFAELCLGPAVHRWLNMPVERSPRPHVERWYRTLAGRPSAAAGLPLPVA